MNYPNVPYPGAQRPMGTTIRKGDKEEEDT